MGRGAGRPSGSDGPSLGALALSAALHAVLIALVLLAPHRMQSAPPTAYTVELVDPGAVGGKLLEGPIGGARGRRAPRAEPAPARQEPEPPPKPAEPPPEPEPPPKPAEPEPPSEPERVAEAAPEERDANAIPLAHRPTPRPAPTLAVHATVRPTPRPAASAAVRPRPSETPAPRPKPTATAVVARTKPTITPAAVIASRASAVSTAQPRAAPSPEGAKPAPLAEARQKGATPVPGASDLDSQLAAAIKGIEAKVEKEKGGGPGVTTGGPGGGMGGTERRLEGPPGVGGEGPGGGGALRGLEFVMYYNQMLTKIKESWAWVGERGDLRVTVRFSILPSGEIANLTLVERSGDRGYDASVERAVKRASPLPPPPDAYRKDFADVELTFRPADLRRAP